VELWLHSPIRLHGMVLSKAQGHLYLYLQFTIHENCSCWLSHAHDKLVHRKNAVSRGRSRPFQCDIAGHAPKGWPWPIGKNWENFSTNVTSAQFNVSCHFWSMFYFLPCKIGHPVWKWTLKKQVVIAYLEIGPTPTFFQILTCLSFMTTFLHHSTPYICI